MRCLLSTRTFPQPLHMAATSSLLLHLHHLPSPILFRKLQTPLHFNLTPFQISKPQRILKSFSSPSPSWESEESRWLREEQRWIREESRWIREQSRWNSERESLLQEITNLKNQIQFMERQNLKNQILPETIDLSSENTKQISEIGSGPVPIMLEAEKEEVKETIVEEVRVLKSADEGKMVRKWKQIRKGAEGEDVRAMQEALLKLGFYPGEEDMEFSSFSDDTERAIKSWQASIEVREDGMMTAELLERLLTESGEENYISTQVKDSANGAMVASVTEDSKVKDITVKESGHAEVDPNYHRVFLLGENRWEDSSRLIDRNKKNGGRSTTKCIACRGEGHVLCSECDGTGEPNVEEQFLEWIDEGAKCLYCEGIGFSVCDVCEGKTIIHA